MLVRLRLRDPAGRDRLLELLLLVGDERGHEPRDGLAAGLRDVGQRLVAGQLRPQLRLGEAEVRGRRRQVVEPVTARRRRGGRAPPSSGYSCDAIRSFSASPSAFVIRPAATAASTRFASAFFKASLSSDGWTPRSLAASSITALLSSCCEPPVAATAAAPPAATVRAATLVATILRFIELPSVESGRAHSARSAWDGPGSKLRVRCGLEKPSLIYPTLDQRPRACQPAAGAAGAAETGEESESSSSPTSARRTPEWR